MKQTTTRRYGKRIKKYRDMFSYQTILRVAEIKKGEERNTMSSRRLIYISIFTALTIVGAYISFPIPFTPIEFSLQPVFVIMGGLILGGKDGAISQIAYVMLGLIGVPVFALGGGISYIFQPSFGYLIGFILGAYACGTLRSNLKTLSTFKLFLCCLVGLLSINTLGIIYQIFILTSYTGLAFASALATIPSIFVLFVKDAALLFLICLLYPRIMAGIDPINQPPTRPANEY